MAVRIRLNRIGSKKQPHYRIVVSDQRSPRDGKYLEIIGHYNPRTRPQTEVLQEDRALYWLSVGAQPSEAVQGILRRVGTQERYERLSSGSATIEQLVAEVEANPREMPDPRTNYPAPGDGESKIKAREAGRLQREQEAAEVAQAAAAEADAKRAVAEAARAEAEAAEAAAAAELEVPELDETEAAADTDAVADDETVADEDSDV